MKLSNVKAMVAKAMAIGLVAGAVALVAPAKAEAQQFAVGVQFGPSYHDEGRRDFYERERYEQQREAIARHEAWEQQMRFEQHEQHERHEQQERWEHSRGYRYDGDRGGDRDRGQGWSGNGYGQPRGDDGR